MPEVAPAVAAPAEPAKPGAQPVAPPKPPETPGSERFAKLAANEARLQQQRTELKSERAAIDAQRAELKSLAELTELAKSNPREAMKRLGIDYGQVTKEILADPTTPEQLALQKVTAEVEALKTQRQQEAKERAQQLEKAKADAVAKFSADIEAAVRADPEAYELVNLTESYELVVEVIEQDWQKNGRKTGKILDTKEAAAKVEAYLEAQQIEAATKSKKLRAKLGLKDPAPAPADGKKPSPTITNALPIASQAGDETDYSDQAIIRRAVAAGRAAREAAKAGK